MLFSEASKQVAVLELTVAWEERMEEDCERKGGKYVELMEDCQTRECEYGVCPWQWSAGALQGDHFARPPAL